MNFTASQKKWALTASLATVLSFNLVMSLGYNDFGSATLASKRELTEDEAERFERLKAEETERVQKAADEAYEARQKKTASRGEGPFKMRNVEINDQKEDFLLVKEGNKTRAIKSNPTEAEGTCSDCLSRLLPVAFDAHLDDIAKALKKSYRETPASGDDSKTVDSDLERLRSKSRKAVKEVNEDEENGKAALAKLTAECRNKKHYADREDKINCFADGLSIVLAKDLTFDKSAVLKIFANEIGAPLMDFLKTNPNSERHTFAVETINKLAAELPEDANYLRQVLTRMNAKVVRDAEVEVQTKVNQYRQLDQAAKQNPANIGLRQQANLLGSQIDQEQSKVNQLGQSLGVNLKSGFESAIASDYLTPTLASQYLNVDYFGQVNTIIKGFENSVKTNTAYTIPNIDLTGGTIVTLADGTSLVIQQAAKTGNVLTSPAGIQLQSRVSNASPIQAGIPLITSNGGQNTATITVVNAPVAGSQQFTGTRSNAAGIPMIRGN